MQSSSVLVRQRRTIVQSLSIRAGFTEIELEKYKLVPSNLTGDDRVIAADKAMGEAKKTGYMIQIFDE